MSTKTEQVQPSIASISCLLSPEDARVLESFPDYLRNGPQQHSLDTIRTYSNQITSYIKHLASSGPVSLREAITKASLNQVLIRIPIEKDATRRNMFWAVKSFARYLGDFELIEDRSAESIANMKLKSKYKPKRLGLSPEQREAALHALLASPEYDEEERLTNMAIFATLAFSGLRNSELCNLKLEDVDFERGIIRVVKGKGGKSRTLGLSKRLVPLLSLYLQNRPASKTRRFFVGPKGTALNRDLLDKRFSRMSEHIGIKVAPHMLRRSFATITAHNGVPLDKLQTVLGHADIQTTRNYVLTEDDSVAREMCDW